MDYTLHQPCFKKIKITRKLIYELKKYIKNEMKFGLILLKVVVQANYKYLVKLSLCFLSSTSNKRDCLLKKQKQNILSQSAISFLLYITKLSWFFN